LKPNELNGEKYFRLAENRPYEPGNGFADREMTLLIRKCLRRAGMMVAVENWSKSAAKKGTTLTRN
jgi:hypothetical protein